MSRKTSSPWPRKPEIKVQGRSPKLAPVIQGLAVAEKASVIANVPGLQSAIGLALVIAEAVNREQANASMLESLAQECGELLIDVVEALQLGYDTQESLPTNFVEWVQDLMRTLESVKAYADALASRNKIWRLWVYKDIRDKVTELRDEFLRAQSKFATLSHIRINRLLAPKDTVIRHGDIKLEKQLDSGNDWETFKATLTKNTQNAVIKRYTSSDKQRRKSMFAEDCAAFKKLWHPNLLAFIGTSCSDEEFPYIVLRGTTSEHVKYYITSRFCGDDIRNASGEAMDLLHELTIAFRHILINTDSASFDLSKVHLNEAGHIVVVDLEPCLERTMKNTMLHWRSWQDICIELLSGDRTYEPNPAVDYVADGSLQRRLLYLRPVLGLIQAGGLRFRDRIESAFKRQADLFKQVANHLTDPAFVHPSTNANTLLSPYFQELHFAAQFSEPLDVSVGDIGYITGAGSTQEQFVRLENVCAEVSNGSEAEISSDLFYRPRDRWTRDLVNETVRHTFRFCDADVSSLNEWKDGRPGIAKDFRAQNINQAAKTGLLVDCTRAWHCLSEKAPELAANHSERAIRPSDLILVVFVKQHSGHATFQMNRQHNPTQWRSVWEKEGFDDVPQALYFYEHPPGGRDCVWGYFSFSPVPGTPHRNWTPKTDDAGYTWGWTFSSEDWTIEISKPNVKQYIRYVQLDVDVSSSPTVVSRQTNKQNYTRSLSYRAPDQLLNPDLDTTGSQTYRTIGGYISSVGEPKAPFEPDHDAPEAESRFRLALAERDFLKDEAAFEESRRESIARTQLYFAPTRKAERKLEEAELNIGKVSSMPRMGFGDGVSLPLKDSDSSEDDPAPYHPFGSGGRLVWILDRTSYRWLYLLFFTLALCASRLATR